MAFFTHSLFPWILKHQNPIHYYLHHFQPSCWEGPWNWHNECSQGHSPRFTRLQFWRAVPKRGVLTLSITLLRAEEDRLWTNRLKSNYSHWPQRNPIKTSLWFKEVISNDLGGKTPTSKLQTGHLHMLLSFFPQRTSILKERQQWPWPASLI